MLQTLTWSRRLLAFSLLFVFLSIILAGLFASLDNSNDPGHLVRKQVRSTLESSWDLNQNVSRLFRRSDLDPYSCTKDIPCQTHACCGSFFGGEIGTCGYGDTYCGSDCVSNCNATAECGQHADPPGKTCPLNVCCSQYGFCGTSDEFCSTDNGCQSNCGHPSVPPGKSSAPVLNRVFGISFPLQ